MYARLTQFEIDTLRIGMADAVQMFQDAVLPELRNQPGYLGIHIMHTPEGRGVLVTFWDSEEAATAAVQSGFYDEQVQKFVLFTRQPPDRDHYEVVFSESLDQNGGAAKDQRA